MLDTLCGVSHAYGLEVGSLSYLVIPWVFGCGTVCHVVIYGFKGFLIGLHSCYTRPRESYGVWVDVSAWMVIIIM